MNRPSTTDNHSSLQVVPIYGLLFLHIHIWVSKKKTGRFESPPFSVCKKKPVHTIPMGMTTSNFFPDKPWPEYGEELFCELVGAFMQDVGIWPNDHTTAVAATCTFDDIQKQTRGIQTVFPNCLSRMDVTWQKGRRPMLTMGVW